MIFRSSTIMALALTTGSDAFRNGNTPQADPKTVSKPPSPFCWPIVGSLPDFLARGGVDGMADVHESMYNDYGPVYSMDLMGEQQLVFSDPRVFDQMLRKEGKFPVGAAEATTTFADYYKENDMSFAAKSISRGAEWKEYRSAMNADMFVLWGTYLPVIAETCRKISDVAGKEVTETKRIQMGEFLSRSAFDMFCAVLHGESPETTNSDRATPEDIEFVSATKQAFDITGSLMSNPLEKAFGGNLYKEFVVNMEKTIGFAEEKAQKSIEKAKDTKAKFEVNEKKALEAVADETESSSGCPISAIKSKVRLRKDKVVPTDYVNPSVVERLMDRDDLTPEQISETQAPLLMAGVDTTAYVMSWFYLNMASNPDVQAKLAKELDEKLQGADVTTVEQMESLTYLKMCFRESHRLTPPGAVSVKTIEEDIVVESEGKNYLIPGGQRATLNLRGMPLDPKYVENPTQYIPERFTPEAMEARKGTPSEIALDHPYFIDPFGRGKRKCLGANVAIAEMTVLAARLLQDWEISMVDPSEASDSATKSWKSKQKLMLIADPYPDMIFTPRTKTN